MTIQAGQILVDEIMPRVRAAIPGSTKKVGSESNEELIADCLAHAAAMLHRLEERGKIVAPSSVAHYAILHTRSGRRSTCGNRSDILSSATQLDGKSCVLSFEEEVGCCEETGEAITLGEMLAGGHEDPSMAAGRNLDWEAFLDTHDSRYRDVVTTAAAGKPLMELARERGVCASTMSQLKRRLAAEVRESFGEEILAEVCRRPGWQGNLEAEHEKSVCRAERRKV